MVFDALSGLLGSGKKKALRLYKQGMDKARNGDLNSAVEAYSRILKMDDAPDDLRAMATLNRGLAFSSSRDYDKAESDYQTVLAMPAATNQLKSTAREKLKRLQLRTKAG